MVAHLAEKLVVQMDKLVVAPTALTMAVSMDRKMDVQTVGNLEKYLAQWLVYQLAEMKDAKKVEMMESC